MASFELISLVPTWKHLLKSPKKSVQWKACLQHLKHFFPCVLISVDKNPGFPLMGVGEILHCIVDKAVVSSLGESIVSFFANLQVWEGQERDCQSVVQAMHVIYDNQGAVAVLFADASNMFDSTNIMSSYPMLHYFDIVIPLIIDF